MISIVSCAHTHPVCAAVWYDTNMALKTIIGLSLVALSEASIGVFVKLTGGEIPLMSLNFYRVFFAALFLAATVPFVADESWKFPRDNLRDVAIVGGLIALQISFFNWAMTMAPIANVVIFWSVAPFFVFIFSSVFLNEKPRWVHVFIFLIAIVGIVIAEPLAVEYWAGNVVALIDGAIYAAMVTYLRHEGKTEADNDMFWFMATAAVILAPSLAIWGPGSLTTMMEYSTIGLSIPVWVWAVCLGVISTGLAFFCISVVLRDVDANVYSLVDIITSPIVAGILGWLVFGEVPSQSTVIGGALLIGAGFWLTRVMSHTPERTKSVPGGVK